jgi:hypothetical protein
MATPYVISSDLVSAYPAKSLEIAQYIDGFKADLALVQNAQTGTTYTFVAADFTKLVTASNAAASTYTVPPQSSVTWPANTLLRVTNLGAGVVTFAGGVGVTVTNTAATLAQYQTATLVRTGSDAWTVIKFGGTAPGMVLVASASLSGSSVLVTGCFSATYDNYQIVLQATNSASNDVQMRLLNGSTPDSSSNYQLQIVRGGTGSAIISANNSAATYWPVTSDGQSATISGNSLLYSPFLAVPTRQIMVGAAAGVQQTSQAQLHTASTSFDGMQFYPAAGTFTSGTVKIYGLRN